MQEKINEQIKKIDELAAPLHAYIKENLPKGSFRSNQAWARLQECVNWASQAVMEGVLQQKKRKSK